MRDAIGRSVRTEIVSVFTAEIRERGLQDAVHLLHRDVLLHASNHAQRSIPAVTKTWTGLASRTGADPHSVATPTTVDIGPHRWLT